MSKKIISRSVLNWMTTTCMMIGGVTVTPPDAHAKIYIEPEKTDNQLEEKVFGAQTATLENGLQIVVIENSRAPVLTHMIWYQVGSADEPRGDGVSGAAHFLEHLMFKGSKALSPGEFSKLIRSIGGTFKVAIYTQASVTPGAGYRASISWGAPNAPERACPDFSCGRLPQNVSRNLDIPPFYLQGIGKAKTDGGE